MSIQRYALIIGAMKSATTSLFSLMEQHPRIIGSDPKESGFFAFDDIFAHGRDWYDALFDFDPAKHVWALDGSTDYSKAPWCGDVPARVASFDDADVRLIYVMRHPLRRIESHARHVQRTRCELGQRESTLSDHGLDSGISPVSLSISRYASQIDVWRSYHDAGRLLLLFAEDIGEDPVGTIERVCAFLDVDPPARIRKVKDDNRAGSHRERAPIWDRLRAVPGLARIVTTLVPNKLRRALDQGIAKKVIVSGRFQLTPIEEVALVEELRPDLERLRDVYGVDVERRWGIALEKPGDTA